MKKKDMVMMSMTEKRYIEGVKGFDDYDAWDNETEQGLSHSEVVNELNRLSEENEQLKKKILEEIDLEVAYVNETHSDGRMSKEQHNGAIISLRQLREKFE